MFTRIREAIGTVYGDIGTSVLYTIMEITNEAIKLKNHHHLSEEQLKEMIKKGGPGLITPNEALGGLSLVYWALIFLTVKYDLLIMRADNRGEGGTFALWGLLRGYTGKIFGLSVVGYLVVLAAGLLAADGIITPPISMLGAYQPAGELLAIMLTLVSLIVLFSMQSFGTSKVGGLFGWFMMIIWFPWIAAKAVPWILAHPEVFSAINPLYGIGFLTSYPGLGAFVIMGVLVLAITGGEAKYADIGHFSGGGTSEVKDGESLPPANSGRRPVMYSWLLFVMPCLVINYSGQVAYLLDRGVPPDGNTFYALTPKTGTPAVDRVILVADVFISAIAAFIASQALITGMFSIVKQAIVLGFAPRHQVIYTSRAAEGQVYIPAINWQMFFGCVIVVLLFRNASNLAAAYGIAVTGTMGITTVAFGYVAFYRWGWSLAKVFAICTPILLIDLLFFFSNTLKFMSGGYFPVFVAISLFTIMIIWQWGRSQLSKAFYDFGVKEGRKLDWLVSLREMVDDIQMAIEQNLPMARALIQGRRRLVESDRAAVFLCSRPVRSTEDYVPITLRIFLKKYGVLPSQIVLLYIEQLPVAESDRRHRYEVIRLGNDIESVIIHTGYMEQVDVRQELKELKRMGKIDIAADRWIIEVGEEEIIIERDVSVIRAIGLHLFRLILKLSTPAHKYFGLVYDAAVSKEMVPVVFRNDGAKVHLPELEIAQPAS